MNKFRKVLCFSLALSLTLSLCINLKAEAAETRASAYLAAYRAYVYTDGNDVSVWYDVCASGTMDEVGVLTIRLQEQAPGSSTWTTVKTYSHTNYPDLLRYNYDIHYGHVDYIGRAECSYRAYVTVWAGKNGDGDSRIILAT